MIQRGRDGHSEPDHTAAGIGEEEERSSTNAIDQIGSKQRPTELLAVVDQGDVGLSNVARDSNGGQDFT